jgi:hypothetical protein
MSAVTLGRLDIACLVDGPPGASVERWASPVDAVLGATAFDRETVLVMDLRHKRITVVRSKRFPAT